METAAEETVESSEDSILLYVFLVAALARKVPLTSLAGTELALASALEIPGQADSTRQNS